MNYYIHDPLDQIKTCAPEFLLKTIEEHKIKIVSSGQVPEGVYLHYSDNKLSLSTAKRPKDKPTYVDFTQPQILRRLTEHGVRSELLAKCLGKNFTFKTALDATCGLGTDALILSSLGLKVHACEISPLVYLILKDGLERAKLNESLKVLLNNMTIWNGDSLNYLSTTSQQYDVIYLDLMFSSSDKKSKSKKNMEIFKKLNINNLEQDPEEVLEQYLSFDSKRLIFKRPLKSPLIKVRSYSHSIKGKAIRYDIYVD